MRSAARKAGTTGVAVMTMTERNVIKTGAGRAFGRQVGDVMGPGEAIDWSLGRKRGLGI